VAESAEQSEKEGMESQYWIERIKSRRYYIIMENGFRKEKNGGGKSSTEGEGQMTRQNLVEYFSHLLGAGRHA
jgi:hypothetical protein